MTGLANLRRARGLTLHALSARSGVNYMKIHQIERGKINIENVTLRIALKLARALDCEPEDLIPSAPDES